MVSIALPTKPTLSCKSQYAPVAVVVTYKNGINPISSANIKFTFGYSIFGNNEPVFAKTDIKGLAQICVEGNRYVKLVSIQKQNVNFGSGIGATHYLNIGIRGTTRGYFPYMYKNILAITDIDDTTKPASPIIKPPIISTIIPEIKSPVIPKCDVFGTEHATESIPNAMRPNTQFKVILTGITDFCKTNPSDPSFRKLVEGVGTVKIDNLEGRFPVSKGRAEFDLNKLFDLSILTGGISIAPKIITTEKTPVKSITKPTGRFGGSVVAASAYILQYYGTGYSVKPTTFGGGTAVKIIRPNGSYFYAQSYEQISNLIHWGGN